MQHDNKKPSSAPFLRLHNPNDWMVGNSHLSGLRKACPSSVILAIGGVFIPVLANHSKSFLLIDCISVGVDRMQRNFDPMRKQVEAWQKSELTDVTAKVVIYEAFVESKLEAPKHSLRPLCLRRQCGFE